MPSHTVEVAAADLPAYINTLPRLLTEDLLLYVSGTATGALSIIGFYGSGSLSINGRMTGADWSADNQFSVHGYVRIDMCSVPISICGMTVAQTQDDATLLQISRCTLLEFQSLTLAGTNKTGIGNSTYSSGQVTIIGLKASGLNKIIVVGSDSTVGIITPAGQEETSSNNTYGIQVWRNGIVVLSNDTPTTLGGTTNLKTDAGCIIQNGAFVV